MDCFLLGGGWLPTTVGREAMRLRGMLVAIEDRERCFEESCEGERRANRGGENEEVYVGVPRKH